MYKDKEEKEKGMKLKMKTAFLFPGKGAQTIGMGKDIYDKYEEENKKCRNKYNYYSSVVIVNSNRC